MTDLFTALALVLVIEGCLLALFPDGLRRMWRMVQDRPAVELRAVGLAAAVIGTGIVWLIKS